MPESHFHSLSADIENIKALCFKCHEWWHLNPCESGKWFAGKFPDRFANLTRKARENKIIDRVGWEKMLVKLKKMLPKD